MAKFKVGDRVYYPIRTWKHDETHELRDAFKTGRDVFSMIVPENPTDFKDGRILAVLPNGFYLVGEYKHPGHEGETRHENQILMSPKNDPWWIRLFGRTR